MLSILTDRTFRHLFLAQLSALLGTGIATVALGLLAYDLAGGNAALVLGTIFAIKMVCYIGIAPFAGALADRVPRRTMLVALDLVRAAIAVLLLMITEVWQIYLLIFLLQSASAAFTPTFQATIPDVLTDEDRYTKALSLSRLAYDLENLISPLLAAALLVFVSYNGLFLGTSLGFAASALLILSVILPIAAPAARRSIKAGATRGMRIYLATPRLRGLLALNMAAAAAGAMVLVNTVVLLRSEIGLGDADVAIALGVFGGGSMLAALILPRILGRFDSRNVMLAGTALLCLTLAGLAVTMELYRPFWFAVIAAWFAIGVGYSAVLTPAGRLLRRSSHAEDRPALFAAQFSLSHACWLVTYPLAGWLMTVSGPATALWVLASVAAAGLAAALLLWPADEADMLEHSHDDLPPDHPHLQGGGLHRHRYVIDDHHPQWPSLR